jgi:hypothetical protein
VLRPQLRPTAPPRRVARCPEPQARVGVVSPHTPGAPTSWRPLSLLFSSPGIPSSVPTSQDLLCAPPTKAAHALPVRDAFRRQVPSAPIFACAPIAASWAATGTLATLPPRARLPTCFHPRCCRALDPNPEPALAGVFRPHAACRLLQWSAPRAHLRTVQTPPAFVAAASRCTDE